MSVEPGFGGQSYIESSTEKIGRVKTEYKNIFVQVDGGINAQTARICTSYGANSLVAGSYIYKSENVEEAISSLR